jgi:hypothetical protein
MQIYCFIKILISLLGSVTVGKQTRNRLKNIKSAFSISTSFVLMQIKGLKSGPPKLILLSLLDKLKFGVAGWRNRDYSLFYKAVLKIRM